MLKLQEVPSRSIWKLKPQNATDWQTWDSRFCFAYQKAQAPKKKFEKGKIIHHF